jgi:tRNA pseudouridine32 synthase / 23S rRNA pseudouridine746 synthase
MKILFEDSDLIAVLKPAGWLSVPSSKGKLDPRSIVGIELQSELQTQIFPLHRLDCEVSGVLAFAKNAQTQSKLLQQWESGRVKKKYRALSSLQNFSPWPDHIEGKVIENYQESQGELKPWKSLLVAGKRRAFVAPHGAKSLTNWKIIKFHNEYIEWELEPMTGRRHQLRVEMSRRGFPIWGDRLYGSSYRSPENQIALHAVSLQIEGYNLIQSETDWSPWIKK